MHQLSGEQNKAFTLEDGILFQEKKKKNKKFAYSQKTTSAKVNIPNLRKGQKGQEKDRNTSFHFCSKTGD